MATQAPPEIVSEIQTKWGEAQSTHTHFVNSYERRERAYKGLLHSSSSAAKWRHKLHPPYAHNVLETIISSTIEQGLRFDVKPAPHVNPSLEEAMHMLDQAESVGDLLRHEHRIDDMDAKQRPLFLTAAIGGRGVGKSYWNYTEGTVRKQGIKMVDVHDDQGNVLISVPTVTEIVEKGVLRDHSTCEIIDPRDFVVHESAKALQPWEPGGAQHVFHRCWYSYEQLLMLQASGFFKNVEELKNSRDYQSEYTQRETSVYQTNRAKDLIEVWEYWCMKDGLVYRTCVGNRTVVLRDEEESPFWHGGYPFFVCTSMPQPFSTIGTSEIELIEALQEILWELANQRLDNVELINNFITLIRSDVDDPDAFEWYPGARWPVDDVSQVSALQPPYQLAETTLSAEALIKGDLQNVTSSAPFSSGTQTASVDQKTATGASIVMNAAQSRLAAKKYEAQRSLQREAWMRLKNCQQFIDGKKLVHIIGADGAATFKELDPLDIQGEFICELEPIGESNIRQERRAEAMQWLQVLMQSAPMAAAGGVPLNLKEVFKWAFKLWDIEDSDRFFSQKPQSQGVVQNPPGGPGGAPGASAAPPGQPQSNLGVTAGSAVDAASPSAAGGIGSSPVQALQRAMALSGGAKGR